MILQVQLVCYQAFIMKRIWTSAVYHFYAFLSVVTHKHTYIFSQNPHFLEINGPPEILTSTFLGATREELFFIIFAIIGNLLIIHIQAQ